MERICVGGLVVARAEPLRILLGRRSPTRASFPDVWDLPGGHAEPAEVPEQALIRELREELGVVPTAWRLLAQVDVPTQGANASMTLYVYEVSAWTGTPANRQAEEHAEIGWFTIDEACRLSLAHPSYVELFRQLAAMT